jgi:transposase
MNGNRRVFTPEFKQEAVTLVQQHHKPAEQVAKELGIDPSTLRRWRRAFTGQTEIRCQGGSPEETAQLRRELERVRMERDILKNGPHGLPCPLCIET